MAEAPALPLWTDAYLADTGHLTTLEHGAYLLLLMTMWRSGGSLSNDDKKLARYCRLTTGQWARIKPTIIEFFQVSSDSITQGRLTDELVHVRQVRKKQSENARAKYRKTNNTNLAMGEPKDDLAEPDGCQTSAPIPIPIEKEDTSVSSKKTNPTRGTRLPSEWKPSLELLAWAKEKGIGPTVIERETENFVDWWPAQPGQKGVKVCWDLTWKSWMRRSCDVYGGNNGKNNSTTQRSGDIEKFKRNACTVLEEVIAYNEAIDAAGLGTGDIGQDERTSQRRLVENSD